MKEYCFDTSGLSNPLESMPDDIHKSMWAKVQEKFEGGIVAVTQEIFDEMSLLGGGIGKCVKRNKSQLVLEVGHHSWDWQKYVECIGKMQEKHYQFIAEYNGNSPKTICLNDLSIIALAKCLNLPVVSMESSALQSLKKRRIPDICSAEKVVHLGFSDFLRKEKIQI